MRLAVPIHATPVPVVCSPPTVTTHPTRGEKPLSPPQGGVAEHLCSRVVVKVTVTELNGVSERCWIDPVSYCLVFLVSNEEDSLRLDMRVLHHQAGRRQPCTASSGASAGKSKPCKGASVRSISLRRRDLLMAGGLTLGSTLLLQSPQPAWALEPPLEGSPALTELYADCRKVCDSTRVIHTPPSLRPGS